MSRAFNAPHLLRPETVEIVTQTARDLGYVPNRHARALITGRSGVLGLVVPDLLNPFFPPVIRAAQREAEKYDLTVLVAETAGDPEVERRHLMSLIAQCEGIIVCSSRLGTDDLQQLAADTRVVFLNNDVPGAARILLTSAGAFDELITERAEHGEKRFCYLGGPSGSWAERERRSSIELTMGSLGLHCTFLRAESGTYAEAYALVDDVLASRATVVLCFDDVIAMAVLNGVTESGRLVPGDIRLLGCDDTLPFETRPRLSTIRMHTDEAGALAVQLLATDDLGAVPETRVELPGVLTRRATT